VPCTGWYCRPGLLLLVLPAGVRAACCQWPGWVQQLLSPSCCLAFINTGECGSGSGSGSRVGRMH